MTLMVIVMTLRASVMTQRDSKDIDIVEPLLDNSTDSDSSTSEGHSNYILNIAHNSEHYEVVRLLLEYGADPSVLSGIGLRTACELGYTEVAQHIIHESHVSPDVLEQCIESAYKNGFLEAVLEAIMDISDQDVKDHCVQLVRTGETRRLADTVQGILDTVSDDISLWRCLEKRNIARMRVLINSGQGVNIPNITGRSLLQECIHSESLMLFQTCVPHRFTLITVIVLAELHCSILCRVQIFSQFMAKVSQCLNIWSLKVQI